MGVRLAQRRRGEDTHGSVLNHLRLEFALGIALCFPTRCWFPTGCTLVTVGLCARFSKAVERHKTWVTGSHRLIHRSQYDQWWQLSLDMISLRPSKQRSSVGTSQPHPHPRHPHPSHLPAPRIRTVLHWDWPATAVQTTMVSLWAAAVSVARDCGQSTPAYVDAKGGKVPSTLLSPCATAEPYEALLQDILSKLVRTLMDSSGRAA